jgi:hypothetical protein
MMRFGWLLLAFDCHWLSCRLSLSNTTLEPELEETIDINVRIFAS